VRVAGELEAARVDAFAREHFELGEQHRRVDDHAVADDRDRGFVEDAARDELEGEHLAVDDDRVAGVVAALVAHDEGRLLGEVVGEATLALVTPLGADDHRAGHSKLLAIMSNAGRARDRAHTGVTWMRG
jgi:hypothetical protein